MSIDETAIRTHFEKEVHNHTELDCPGDDVLADEIKNESTTDGSQSGLVSSSTSTGIAITALSVVTAPVAVLTNWRRYHPLVGVSWSISCSI